MPIKVFEPINAAAPSHPHWMEFAVSIGLVVVALIVFQIAVRVLPLTHLEESVTKDKEHTAHDEEIGTGTTKA